MFDAFPERLAQESAELCFVARANRARLIGMDTASGTVVGALFVYAVLGSRRASRLSP